MANDANLYPLVPPAAFTTGLVARATVDAGQDLALTQNWLFRVGGVTQVHQEGWPDGHFTHSGAAINAFNYRLPTIGDRHLLLDLVFSVTLDVGTATITATSVGGAGVAVAAVVPGGPVEVTAAGLALAAPFDDIAIEVVTTGGGVLVVHHQDDTPQILAHPLPAQSIDGGSPIGINRIGADYPINAQGNLDMRTNTASLLARRRPIWIKGELNPAIGGPGGLPDHMLSRSWHRVWKGSAAEERTLTAYAYVSNATGLAQNLYWQAGNLRGLPNAQVLVSVANGFTGWVGPTAIPIEEGAFLGGYSREAALVGILRDTNNGFGRSNLGIHRVAVWEEW